MKAINPYDKMMQSKKYKVVDSNIKYFNLNDSFKEIKKYKLIENWEIFFTRKDNEFIFVANWNTKIWEIKADQLSIYNLENLYKLSAEYLLFKV